MLQASWLKSKALAITWFVIMCILFFLPGSAFPKENWFHVIHFDKWVHCGLFAVLLFLWCSAFDFNLPKNSWLVIAAAIAYGFLVEVIQKEWVTNRSFDLYDVLADSAGSILGVIVWLRMYRKK